MPNFSKARTQQPQRGLLAGQQALHRARRRPFPAPISRLSTSAAAPPPASRRRTGGPPRRPGQRACGHCRARQRPAGSGSSSPRRWPRPWPAPRAVRASAPPSSRPGRPAIWLGHGSFGCRAAICDRSRSARPKHGGLWHGRLRHVKPRGFRPQCKSGSKAGIQGRAQQPGRHVDDRDDPLVGHAGGADDAEDANDLVVDSIRAPRRRCSRRGSGSRTPRR